MSTPQEQHLLARRLFDVITAGRFITPSISLLLDFLVQPAQRLRLNQFSYSSVTVNDQLSAIEYHTPNQVLRIFNACTIHERMETEGKL